MMGFVQKVLDRMHRREPAHDQDRPTGFWYDRKGAYYMIDGRRVTRAEYHEFKDRNPGRGAYLIWDDDRTVTG